VKNPDKIVPPDRDLVLIVLRVEDSGDHVPVTLLDDLPLDLGDSSAIGKSVSESLGVPIAGLAHVVSCPIALSTDRVSSSNRFPSNPRSRA
jgi:hypothetical protein